MKCRLCNGKGYNLLAAHVIPGTVILTVCLRCKRFTSPYAAVQAIKAAVVGVVILRHVICGYCGTKFVAKTKRKKYCMDTCRAKVGNRKKSPEEWARYMREYRRRKKEEVCR